MKNTKRMMAVIAATGLALGAMPGVANAQGSEDLLDLDLDLGIGQSVDLGVNLGLGSLGIDPDALPDTEFPALTGSLEGLDTATGSDDLAAGSADLGPAIGEALEAGSLGDAGSDELFTGSDDLGSDDLGSITEGSTDAAGDLDFGSIFEGSTNEAGDIDLGSLSPDAGSLEDVLEDITSGSAAGSSEILDILETGSENVGSDILVQGSAGDEGSLQSDDIMTLGSIAAVSIGIGLAAQGGIALPPLPEINVGAVCQLPQEAIDFLKNNGSMDRDECLPEEQN